MAEFLRIAWPYSPWGTDAQIRSAFQGLLDLGINAICCYRHIDDYKDDASATDRYDLRYNIAAEMGIKIIQYTGAHRLNYKGAKTGEHFVQRYIKFPACAGFLYGDEPALQGWDHDGCKWAVDEAHRQGAGLPDHPMIPVWNYGITYPQFVHTIYPNWGELYDVGCIDCYPYALWGTNPLGPPGGMHYWINYTYRRNDIDGFGDTGKGMIPVIQAFVGSNGVMPDLVAQYRKWLEFYPGDQMKGIAFWLPSVFLASGSTGENLRNQIKEVSLLTGWSPEEFTTEELTCSGCGAGLELTISSIAEKNVSQGCPVCGIPAD